jgi:hypothetical protein
MARKIITNDINALLEMIREQSAIIAGYEGKIPQIEIDLVMANIRRLYEDFVELKRLNKLSADQTIKKQETEEIPEDKELMQIIKPIVEEKKEEPVDEEIRPKEEQSIPQEVRPTLKTLEQDLHKKGKQNETMDLFGDSEPVTLADKYREQKQSTHEKFADANKEKTLADTIKHPIKDLKSGIGVNDRFLFINELFKGVMGDYDMAITGLDHCENLEHGLLKLAEFGKILRWNMEADSVKKLEGFLRRKFI